MASSHLQRQVVPPYSQYPVQVTFRLPSALAHTDYFFELDVGKVPMSVQASTSFEFYFDGLGPLPPTAASAQILMYGDLAPAPTLTHYTHIEEIPIAEATHDRVRMGWADVCNTIYFGIFAPQQVQNVNVVVTVGARIDKMHDYNSPWCMCAQYHVHYDAFGQLLDWFRANRSKMILKTLVLIDDHNRNPLHYLMAACGDPSIARLLLVHFGRFISPELEDDMGQSPLFKLLSRPDIHHVDSPKFYRALALAELFIMEAAVATDQQDHVGNTVAHYVCCRHREGAQLLPLLVKAGTPFNIRNNDGRTPLEEAQREQYGLNAMDLKDAERHIAAVETGAPLPVRTLPRRDNVPQRHTAQETMVAPKVINVKDNGLPDNTPKSGAGSSGVVDEARMREEFDRLDTNRNGWLSFSELRQIYTLYEGFGAVQSAGEVDSLVKGLGLAEDGRITFDEFCILMLKFNRR